MDKMALCWSQLEVRVWFYVHQLVVIQWGKLSWASSSSSSSLSRSIVEEGSNHYYSWKNEEQLTIGSISSTHHVNFRIYWYERTQTTSWKSTKFWCGKGKRNFIKFEFRDPYILVKVKSKTPATQQIRLKIFNWMIVGVSFQSCLKCFTKGQYQSKQWIYGQKQIRRFLIFEIEMAVRSNSVIWSYEPLKKKSKIKSWRFDEIAI